MPDDPKYVNSIDDVPMPPYHFGCRTTTIPVLNAAFSGLSIGRTRIARGADGKELVSSEMTYYDWLKTQPSSFQDTAIGPTRGNLLRNGGLSADEFRKLNVGGNFVPRTLYYVRKNVGDKVRC